MCTAEKNRCTTTAPWKLAWTIIMAPNSVKQFSFDKERSKIMRVFARQMKKIDGPRKRTYFGPLFQIFSVAGIHRQSLIKFTECSEVMKWIKWCLKSNRESMAGLRSQWKTILTESNKMRRLWKVYCSEDDNEKYKINQSLQTGWRGNHDDGITSTRRTIATSSLVFVAIAVSRKKIGAMLHMPNKVDIKLFRTAWNVAQ